MKYDKDVVRRALRWEDIFRHYNIPWNPDKNGKHVSPLNPSEKAASFSIYGDGEKFKCFSTNAQGDIFDFIAILHRLDPHQDFAKILEVAAEISGVMASVEKRGALSVTDSSESCEKILAKKKLPFSVLSKAGMRILDNGSNAFINMYDSSFKKCGEQSLSKHIKPGSTLGVMLDPFTLKRGGHVYMVEGLTDYLTMLHLGFNVVSLVSCTLKPKTFFSYGFKDMTIVYDYDDGKAGLNATASAIRFLEKTCPENVNVRFSFMSLDDKDISDFHVAGNGHDEIEAALFCNCVATYKEKKIEITDTGREVKILEKKDSQQLMLPVDEPSVSTRKTTEEYFAGEILKRGGFCSIKGSAWKKGGGIWSPLTKEEANNYVYSNLEGLTEKRTLTKIKGTYDYMAIISAGKAKGLGGALTQDEYYMNRYDGCIFLKDGIYNYNTGESREYADNDDILTTINVSIGSKGAPIPIYQKFIDSVFDGLPDKMEVINFMEEWMAYCCMPIMPFQKFLIMHGTGANGKGTLLGLMTSILGNDNVTNLELSQFQDNRFATSFLYGAYLNQSTDTEKKANLGSPTLKKITGGDTIMVERKNEAAFSYKPHVKMMFAANNMPSASDSSNWLARRLQIVPFGNSFANMRTNGDPFLAIKLEKEKDAVFWHLMKKIKPMMTRGGISTPATVIDTTEKFLYSSDTVIAFFRKRTMSDSVAVRQLYREYRTECMSQGKRTNLILEEGTFRERISNIDDLKIIEGDRVIWSSSEVV